MVYRESLELKDLQDCLATKDPREIREIVAILDHR